MKKNIYTLCRSGSHAIIFWIINNFGGYDTETSVQGVIYSSKSNNICFVNNFNHKVNNGLSRLPETYRNMIVSYEDHYLTQVSAEDLIIIRDFHSTLSSRYRLWQPYLGIKTQKYIHTIEDFIISWKNLANHAICSQKYIYYNSWLLNKSYRDIIMNKFFQHNNDIDNTEFVPSISGGSSYVGTKIEPDKSKYLSRYHETDIPEKWRNLISSDQELNYFSSYLKSQTSHD